MKAERREAAEGARVREPAAEEGAGRGRAGQGDAQGDRGGKLLTPNRRRSAVDDAAGPVRGLRTTSVPSGRPAPLHAAARRRRCRPTTRPSCGLSCEPSPSGVLGGAGGEPRSELRRNGWRVNNKRVRRLWRDEGLQVPDQAQEAPRRRSAPTSARCPRSPRTPCGPWTSSSTTPSTTGRSSCSTSSTSSPARPSPSDVDHSITADDVVAVLDRLAIERGRPPAFVRFDNGPEFVARACRRLVRRDGRRRRSSSTRARRGRTPGSSRSTAGCATSC